MLTKRQKEILDFVESYLQKNNYPPSFEEIKKRTKLASVSTVHFHVSKLQESGYLGNKKSGYIKPYPTRKTFESAIKTKDVRKRKNLPLNQIILGDAIKELYKLPSESCDVIIIDPP